MTPVMQAKLERNQQFVNQLFNPASTEQAFWSWATVIWYVVAMVWMFTPQIPWVRKHLCGWCYLACFGVWVCAFPLTMAVMALCGCKFGAV